MSSKQCLVFVILLAFSLVSAQIDSSEDFYDDSNSHHIPNGQLIQVSVVTRHGQRTPKDPYPADPYRDPKFWPEGWLQLTSVGADQHRTIGRRLRSQYNDTIPFTFTSNSVRIRSTGISRTLASAFALTTTLFPDQAIPIHSTPTDYDKLFSPHKSCPAFDAEMERYLATPEVQEEERRRKPFYDWMSDRIGKRFGGVDAAEGIYSLLTIEKQRGHILPNWTNIVYPQPLRNLTAVFLARSSATVKLARLRYGSLFKDILIHAEHAGKKTPKKFLLYSAHDFTIVGLLNCMGVFDGQPSGFASSITFEVRYSNTPQGNTVDIFYRNETNAPPIKLHINGCGNPCHIVNLQKVLSNIIPDDIEKECMDVDPLTASDASNVSQPISITIICVLCVAFFLLGAVVLLIFTKTYLVEQIDPKLFRRRREYVLIK